MLKRQEKAKEFIQLVGIDVAGGKTCAHLIATSRLTRQAKQNIWGGENDENAFEIVAK